jgi:hypothetical protein
MVNAMLFSIFNYQALLRLALAILFEEQGDA